MPQPAPPPLRVPSAPLPTPTIGDVLFALALVVLGFCFWEWSLLWYGGAGIGTTLFFLLSLLATIVYLTARGIRQKVKSLLLFSAALAGAFPFFLYGYRDINFALLIFETTLCLLWLAYSCRTLLAERFSGLIVGDWLNQNIIIPFANLDSFFTWPARRMSSKRVLWLRVLLALAGIAICVPIFFIVIGLLAESDEGFRTFMRTAFEQLNLGDVIRCLFEFALGIPVAAYIFGVVVGNVFKRRSALLSAEGMRQTFSGAHVFPRAMVYTPLALFVVLYIIYFIAMGNYLFSGLQSELPTAYTYAQYARHGFFELCEVATINLVLLAGVWLFTKRDVEEYPVPLRLLTGLLSLLTCLLIVTAASKMLLYIGSYGLTPLRVYTMWFMGLLLLVFLVLVAWHARPFNAVRPIVILTIAAVLALGLTNTNALVAEYNVQRYLDGRVATVNLDSDGSSETQGNKMNTNELDVTFLAQLGDAALPALYELRDQADDDKVVQAANDIIRQNYKLHLVEYDGSSPWLHVLFDDVEPWRNWQESVSWSFWGWPNTNLQSYQALRLHG
jgi:hypothetical protein